VRYWTVLDERLTVMSVADAFLRQVRFGRGQAELTTKAYAGAIALYLQWCHRTGRAWPTAAGQLGMFMTWLRHWSADRTGPNSAAVV
jgi:integrase/recombinase XerD